MREEAEGEVEGLHCSRTTFVMLNPILNLPELIGHQKHPFTKKLRDQGLVWGCVGGQSKTRRSQLANTVWIKPKPDLLGLCRKKDKTKIRIMLFSLIYYFHS